MRLVTGSALIRTRDDGEDALALLRQRLVSLDDVPPASEREHDTPAVGIERFPHCAIVSARRGESNSRLEARR